MSILAESGAHVKRPSNTSQIIRAMRRAKKPFQGAQVWLTEAGKAAVEAAPAALKSEDLKNDEGLTLSELTLAEQIAEVYRRYGDPVEEGDHLVFRGNVIGDFVHLSMPVDGEEEWFCWRSSAASLPAVAFGAAAKMWIQKRKEATGA